MFDSTPPPHTTHTSTTSSAEEQTTQNNARVCVLRTSLERLLLAEPPNARLQRNPPAAAHLLARPSPSSPGARPLPIPLFVRPVGAAAAAAVLVGKGYREVHEGVERHGLAAADPALQRRPQLPLEEVHDDRPVALTSDATQTKGEQKQC